MLVGAQLAGGSRRAPDDESRADLEPLDLALLLGEQEEAIERASRLDLELPIRDGRAPGEYAGGWV